MITQLAVLGSPIAHSLSPSLHRAAYAVLGLDWRYERRELGSGELAGFLTGLGPEWRGLSLTMPLKREALPLLTGMDDTTRMAGAANTLLLKGHERLGFNTDVHGLVQALRDAGLGSVDRIDVLGGGATAASVVLVAAALGCSELRIATRSPAKSHGLVTLGESLGLRILLGRFEPLQPGADAVVSALPGGTTVPSALVSVAARGTLLFDVAYEPWPSPLASVWHEAGGRAVSGLGMLVHQALRQVRVFVGGDPDLPLHDETAVLEAMAASVGYTAPASQS